jgi:predicted nucleic acid-binding protein
MIVISDTTPIISLMKIDYLDILEKLYKNIIIPRAVYDELIINTDYDDEIDIIKRCTFLKVQDVEENLSVLLLQKQLNLDKGESEAIVLANNINADLIVIDERKARKIAKDIGLNVTGTLGILVEAKQKELIKELKPLLDGLIDNNIRIDKKLYAEILKLVEE